MITQQGCEIGAAAKRRLRVIIESYYDILDQRVRTEHRVRNYAEHAGLIAIVGDKESERLRCAGIQNYKKAVRDAKKDPDGFEPAFKIAKVELDDWHQEMDKSMSKQESYLKRLAMAEIREHPLWTGWLRDVKGIGPCLAGGILAWIDITKAKHVGNLWKYCGLAVSIDSYICKQCGKEIPKERVPSIEERIEAGRGEEPARCPDCNAILRIYGHADRREKGKMTGYNPKAKTLAWKIGVSFVKQNAEKSGYRRLYDQMREKVNAGTCNKIHRNDKKEVIPCFDAHKFAKAKRLTVKIFFAHVYKVWRGLLDLPVSDPFVFGMLGHDKAHYIEPIKDE